MNHTVPADSFAGGNVPAESRILIVDDNPAKLKALTAGLQGVDVEIVTATSGQEALRQLLTQEFAAVLLDVNMPVMDGFETATLIRSRPRSEHLPILFITSERLDEDSLCRGYSLGAVDYLMSPVRPEILRAKVAAFVDLYRLRLESYQQAEELRCKNDTLVLQQAKLRENEELLEAVRHLAKISRFQWTYPDGEWCCGSVMATLLGLDADTTYTLVDWVKHLHPDDHSRVMDILRVETIDAQQGIDLEFRIVKPENGKHYWLHLWGKLATDVLSKPPQLTGLIMDITAEKQFEQQINQQAEQAQQLFECNADGLLIINLDGVITMANGAAGDLFERLPASLIGQPFGTPITVGKRDEINLTVRGVDKTFSMTSAKVNWAGQPSLLVSLRDISQQKQMEEQIRQLAFHDGLTQLPNLRLFSDRLEQALARASRFGSYCALILLDLDNFKLLNDTQGHALGDLLLIEAARRLQGALREMDTVARIGGDEFTLILGDLPAEAGAAAADAERVAEKLRHILAEPYRLELRNQQSCNVIEHSSPASLGVTLFRGGEQTENIVKRADAAMYRAKHAGGNAVCCDFPTPPAAAMTLASAD